MSKDLRVLVVEDSEADTVLLLRELEESGFSPVHQQVDTPAALEAALTRTPWDVVVCDHSMPGLRSLDALTLLRQKQGDVPFIVVSGSMDEENAVSLMKAGANDYVMKGNRARVVPSIERELREAASRRKRREAEEALRQSQRELEEFFDHAPVGLHWEGPDGVILRVNDAELAMLGYSREEFVGHHMSEFHLDESAAEDLTARLRRGESLLDCEARLRCKDGTVKDVMVSANVLLEDGRFVYSRCFTRDITARKRVQEQLNYLAAIVETSEDAIIGTTFDGTIVTWNAGAQRLYGYSADEVKGRSVSLLLPSQQPDELPDIYAQLRRGEWIARYESERLTKNGEQLDVSLTLSPIKDAAGAVVGVSSIERDITVVKREEEERLKLIEELTEALRNIKTLRGLLPICASCKKIRDDKGYWQKVESYISEHTNAAFTHGLCPDCLEKLYPDPQIRK
jgi:PAS domain S-box-containing protein